MTEQASGASQRRSRLPARDVTLILERPDRWHVSPAMRHGELPTQVTDVRARYMREFVATPSDQPVDVVGLPTRGQGTPINLVAELQQQVVALQSDVQANTRRIDALSSAQADRRDDAENNGTRSRESAALYAEFLNLVAQWREETAGYSLITPKISHPAYLRIIGMGPVAVPWILEELKERGGHWFVALRSITGANPVLREDRGRIPKMREAWLAWAREDGWID